jgi:xylulokinase
MMAFALGIDVSTTATKALIVDDGGGVVATASHEYAFSTPRPLWSEQDPALWWEAAVHSIRDVLASSRVDPREVASIGLTGQMHGLVLLDQDGRVLRPAILWNDGRTGEECDLIRELVGAERLIEITGNDALTGFTAPKLLWVKRHEPDVFERVRHVLLPKDYLRYRLTGAFATDKAGAAGTLLMNLKTRDWAPEVLDALEIPAGWLPDTHEGPATTGFISAGASTETGLPEGIPVVAGGGDQAAGGVGVGAVREGIVSLALGTSGVVFATSDSPRIEPEGRLHAFCHAVPDRWHMMGVMLSAAGSLRWFRDSLAPETPFDTLLEPAKTISPGAQGLLFLPYLTGERTPHPDPLARGAFVGLTVRHGLSHLTRAVLEGVAFGLKDGFELMRGAGLPPVAEVRVSGGGARSELWRQIIADVFNTPLTTVNTTEGAAYGAALLAGVGAGMWVSVDAACDTAIRVTGRTEPRAESAAAYRQLYGHYRDLYPALKPSFSALARY